MINGSWFPKTSATCAFVIPRETENLPTVSVLSAAPVGMVVLDTYLFSDGGVVGFVVAVAVGFTDGVCVAVVVLVGFTAGVCVAVAVAVGFTVGVCVAVAVAVGFTVGVCVAVVVAVGFTVAVAVGFVVDVGFAVAVGSTVVVAVGLTVAVAPGSGSALASHTAAYFLLPVLPLVRTTFFCGSVPLLPIQPTKVYPLFTGVSSVISALSILYVLTGVRLPQLPPSRSYSIWYCVSFQTA